MKKAKKARIMSASEIERRTAIAMNGGNPFEGMKDWEVTLDLNDPREREIHKYTQKKGRKKRKSLQDHFTILREYGIIDYEQAQGMGENKVPGVLESPHAPRRVQQQKDKQHDS